MNSEAIATAVSLFFFIHLMAFSRGVMGRAEIGSPSRNRRRSSASSPAVA